MSPVDPALRTVLRFASSRRLYGTTVVQMPLTRTTLAGVFTDLLTAEAAASDLLDSRLHREAMRDLGVVLGARGYLREGEHAVYGETLRTVLEAPPPPEEPGDFERALLLAVTSCVRWWRDARSGERGFLADSAWLRAVLHRVTERRTGRSRPLPEELTEALMTELTARLADGRGFGLGD